MEHQNLFLMPLWRFLGKSRWVLEARTLPKTISISLAVLAVIVFLVIWPAKFEMESKGTLEPVARRDVYASMDGDVVDLKVASGDLVETGQLLVRLRSTKLENDTAIVEGELRSTKERIAAILRSLQKEGEIRPEERNRLRGDIAESREKQASLQQQLALCKINQEELLVKSPISGQVVTWDLRNRLIHRPVQRGQVLMKVADPTGPWQLELHMPENHMGNLAQAWKEIHDKARDKLREMLKEQLRAKSPDVPEEEINNAVEAELAKVPDDQLYDKQVALINEQFHNRLAEIIQTLPDGESKDKLIEVQKQESFADARAKLKEAMAAITDEDLNKTLSALPDKEPEKGELRVAYIMATETGTTHYGTVKEVQYSAEVRGDEGNTVLIKVAINKSDLSELRPGAAVTAKVYCGRRPLGYVLLHDLIAFIQARVIFRYL
jgi:multidrug efflux pump subunit AcrA (membrane-fusion protein)